MKNSLYWSFNLPLQAWPIHESNESGDDMDDEKDEGPVVDYRVLNYMPRKERCEEFKLSEVLEEQTHAEYFEAAAAHLEHLASLYRKLAKGEIAHIYYPDHDMDKSNLA